MTIDIHILKRLDFSRYLLYEGMQCINKTEPNCYYSVILFHDAVDIFLSTGLDLLKIPPKKDKNYLMDEFNEIDTYLKKKGEILEERSAVLKINDVRNNLKHHGIFPNTKDLAYFNQSILDFFENNTSKIFQIKFSEISLIESINNNYTKYAIKEAIKYQENNDLLNTQLYLAIAFDILLRKYELDKKDTHYSRSVFEPKDVYSFDNGPFMDNFINAIQPYKDVIRLLSLGIDFRKYSKFQNLTWSIYIKDSPSPYIVEKGLKDNLTEKDIISLYQSYKKPEKTNPNKNDIQFCIDFIIETANKIQEFEFKIEK